jgi:hypothetical protein
MAPRIDWIALSRHHDYDSVPVMVRDFYRRHRCIMRAAVALGVSESSFYNKLRGVGMILFGDLWRQFPEWPYVEKFQRRRPPCPR